MLSVVGLGGRRGRTLGGGGGRRAGRREREVSGEMGLVRRSGSGGGEEEDEDGGGGYEILPSASSLGRTSFSQSQLPPGAGESASSSATLGPRGESSSTRTAIRPSPFSRQSQGGGPPLSTPSSPASSVRGMVLPPAPSASASPHTHPSNATQQSGHATTTGGSATPLSLSASVMELPSSVPSSAYGGEEGEYDSYESGVESGFDVEEEEEGRTPGVGEGVRGFAGFEERRDEAEGGADGGGGGAAVLGDSWVAVSQSRSDVTTEVDQAEGEGEEKVEKSQDAA
ncbi:hypothetical protein A4X13_0g8296 [Tilletia indica]|uniref:Uncharacterized protein n=1 Tax=Tilletia indica TaxID=43049 RepID=A0A8T8SFC7_9BASI|nr:hypothetical protein A4X13_0g8296 [Tilletia indica]